VNDSVDVYLRRHDALSQQVVQLSPTNRPTLVYTEELPSGELLRFIGRILRRVTPSIPSSYPGFTIGMGKLERLGYNLVKVA